MTTPTRALAAHRLLSALALVTALAAALAPRAAAQQNRDFLLGDLGNLMTAVVAHTHDPDSAWHNPAGLAYVTGTEIQASGSIYDVSTQRLTHLFVTRTSGGDLDTNFTSQSIAPLPNSFVSSFPISQGAVAALGVFVPTTEILDGEGGSDQTFDEPGSLGRQTIRQQIRLHSDLRSYYVGPSIGMHVSERLTFGFSIYGVYHKQATSLHTLVVTSPEATPQSSSSLFEQDPQTSNERLGLLFVTGIQLEPFDGIFVGVTARATELSLWERLDIRQSSVSSTPSAPDNDVEFTHTSGESYHLEPSSPWRVTAGAAAKLGSWLVAGDIEFSTPFDSKRFDRSSRLEVDGRVGARFELNENWSFGAGLFIDQDSQRLTGDFGGTRFGYIGGTIGIQHQKKLEIVTGDKEHETRTPLVISTTVAFRYIYGKGQVEGQIYSPFDGGTSTLAEADATSSEAALYLGAGLRF